MYWQVLKDTCQYLISINKLTSDIGNIFGEGCRIVVIGNSPYLHQ